MDTFKKYHSGLSFVFIFIAVYVFFLQYQTNTVYGDDLLIFQEASGVKFSDILYHPLGVVNGRSVNRIIIYTLIALFKHNLHLYYFFNVFVISLNVFIFSFTLNLFFRSFIFSTLFSLIIGLSRFSYYTISQLTFGGGLEGIGMTFFLLTLFYVIAAFREDSNTGTQKKLLWGLLYANICVEFTHPMYIILFPFFLLIVLFFPFPKKLSGSQKFKLSLITLGSIGLNVFIKKIIYHMPMLIGTGHTDFHFSFSSAYSFFLEGVLSIFQINSGPDYLIGIAFDALPSFDKALVVFILLSACITIGIYLYKGVAMALKKHISPPYFYMLLFLAILFGLCLVPAVVTIRLEQRWLTASFSVFILMFVIMLSSFNYKNNVIKYALFSLLIFSFLWVNFTYLSLGINNTYMRNSERIAERFKKAMDNKTIHPNTERIYVWEKKIDENSNNEIKWAICDGYFFRFYGVQEKQIFFVDSIYTKTGASSFPGFNPSSSQIIFWGAELKDITGEYLTDSLKTFVSKL